MILKTYKTIGRDLVYLIILLQREPIHYSLWFQTLFEFSWKKNKTI